MNKVDPRLAMAGLILIIVLAGAFILRSAGVGKDNTPPPIATGSAGGGPKMAPTPPGSPGGAPTGAADGR